MIRTFRLPLSTILVYALLALLSAAVSAPSVSAMQERTSGIGRGEDTDATCSGGRLRIGDLDAVEGTLDEGLKHITGKATAWQSDARLYTLRLGCPLFTTGVEWEGTFFSETAQAFYSTDTGVVEAVNDDPSTIPLLDPEGLNMHAVYRTLVRAGFNDDLKLGAAGGVTIRYSTETHPFGPDTAPRNQVYAHVAVELNGQVTDVWIAMSSETIYRYGQ